VVVGVGRFNRNGDPEAAVPGLCRCRLGGLVIGLLVAIESALLKTLDAADSDFSLSTVAVLLYVEVGVCCGAEGSCGDEACSGTASVSASNFWILLNHSSDF